MKEMQVLRFFAVDPAALRRILERLAAGGTLQYEQMHKGSEVLVALYADRPADIQAAAQELYARLGADLYGAGDTTLYAAAVAALHGADQLFVAADAETGALLAPRLEKVPQAGAVYDFGTQSYAHPAYGPKIAAGGALGRRAEGDGLLLAQGRMQEACRLSGAHYAVSAVRTEAGYTLLAGSEKLLWTRRIGPEENPALWLMDMLRRGALEAAQADGVCQQPYGKPAARPPRPDAAQNSGAQGQAPAGDTPPADQPDLLHLAAARRTATPRVSPYLPPKEAAPRPAAPAAPAAPARPEKPRRSAAPVILAGILVVAAVAVLAVAAAGVLTGGDLLALWEKSGLREFHVSGASLL